MLENEENRAVGGAVLSFLFLHIDTVGLARDHRFLP